jgi:hypothetical protein
MANAKPEPKKVTHLSTLNFYPSDGDERVIAEVHAHHPDGSETYVADVLARNRKLVICVYGEHPPPELPAKAFVAALQQCMEQVRRHEEIDPEG